MRYALARMLSMSGYSISEAASGSECLERAAQTSPDLVILDVKLPDISGYEVARQLKGSPATARIPILQVSAHFTEPQDLAQGLDGGADAYLVHPIPNLVLLATIKALLRTSKVEQELQRLTVQLEKEIETRNQSEAERQRSHTLMVQAATLSHTGAWEWDLRSDRWSFSDEWLRIHGCTNRSLAPDELLAMAHPDDRAAIARAFEDVRTGVAPYQIEHRIIRLDDGVERVVRARGEYVRDSDGEVVRVYGFAQDITEQKRAEQALQKAHEGLERRVQERTAELETAHRGIEAERQRFHDVLETLPAMIALIRPDHHVAFANRAFRESFGEPEARRCHEFIFGSEKPCSFCQAFSVLDTGQSRHWECSSPDGKKIIDVYNFPFKDTDGSPLILEMDLDISELREAQAILKEANENLEHRVAERTAALRQSEERFRSVLENMSEGLMLFDEHGNLIYQNPASLRIHGFEAPEEGQIQRERLPVTWEAWDDKGRHISFDEWPVSRVFRHERFQDQVLRVVRNETGHEFYGSYNGSPIYDTKGKLVLGFITIREITEQVRAQAEEKRAEGALRESERRLRAIFESDMVGIIYWTTDGRITDANDKFLRMLGYSREDMLAGRIAWARITPPEYRPLDEYALAELKNTGVDTPYEKEYIRKDGTRLPIIIGAAMLDDRYEHGVAFVLDIAYRKSLENQRDRLLEAERFARNEAEKALRLKDEFLSVVSHELRNPLNALMGWTKLLGKGSVDISKAVQIISRSAASLNQIVSDLLDMSRIVSGKTKLEPERTDLIGLIGNVLDSARMASDAKGIRLSTCLDENLEPITCDPNRIQQIVHNLLSNAIKFTSAGGDIRVEVSRLPTAVEIRVLDTGQGIVPEFLPYVFDRFRQADQSITRNHGGLGLGLSIVKHLVELHGGTVCAHSDGQGKGATFTVTLPRHAAVDNQPTVLVPRRYIEDDLRDGDLTILKGRNVLVVDDDPGNCEMVARMLDESGAVSRIAISGEHALSLLGQMQPDLVISDIGMPGMHGYELVRRIRAMGGGYTRLPCVALSAFARPEDRDESLKAGFDEHLSKPFNALRLAQALTRLTDWLNSSKS